MKTSIFKILKQQILIMVCCFSFIGYSQGIKLSENAQISVITCGSGNEMYSIFGHTAIRVKDNLSNLDVVFNYGMFDFNTPNFYVKFLKGDLLYSVGTENFDDFVNYYKQNNRSVNEQYLNLSAVEKQAVFDKITHQINSSERFYQYKFIDNNCTTKVVDLLNGVLSKPLETHFEGNEDTKRNILNSFLPRNYFEKLGINLVFGKNVDAHNEKVFLPEKLMHSISKTKNKDRKLEQNDIVHFSKIPETESVGWNSIYFFSIICLVFSFLSNVKWIQNLYFILIAFLGLIITFVSLFTNHMELIWNETLFLFNPLYFLLLFKKTRNVVLKMLGIGVVLFLIISSISKILILTPLILLNIVFLLQFYRKNSFKKSNSN